MLILLIAIRINSRGKPGRYETTAECVVKKYTATSPSGGYPGLFCSHLLVQKAWGLDG